MINGSSSDGRPRNTHHSPSWSFRWDDRGRVAEEETSIIWLPDGVGTNDGMDNKSQTTIETANAIEVDSPLEGFRSLTRRKSPPSEGNIVCQSGQSNSRNPPESREIPAAHLVSSSPMSSSQGHHPPLSSLRLPPGRHLVCHVSGTKSPRFSISEEGSLFIPPDDFSDHMGISQRDIWGSSSPSITIRRTCGVCSNCCGVFDVVGILICGHVYHDKCLESMTPGIDKYDPACPVCTLGEKKLSELRAKKLRSGPYVEYMKRKPCFLLRKHLSFGSKSSRSWKNGFFCARSGKE